MIQQNPTLTLAIIQILGCVIAILLMYIYWLQKEINEAIKLAKDICDLNKELLEENVIMIKKISKLIQPKPGVENFKKANECEVDFELATSEQIYESN